MEEDTMLEGKGEGLHLHCVSCRMRNCTTFPNCPVINCPNDCGIRLHTCKVKDHTIVCINQLQPCVNQGNGCPFKFDRISMGAHLEVCPASAIVCNHNWVRSTLYSDEPSSTVLPTRNPVQVVGQLDTEFALSDQLRLNKRRKEDEKNTGEQSSQDSDDNINLSKECAGSTDSHISLDLSVRQGANRKDPKNDVSFSCSKILRRDQIGWHYKNVHSDIQENFATLFERCPMARHGCTFFQVRLKPKYGEIRFSRQLACFTATSDELSSVCVNDNFTSGILVLGYDMLLYLLSFLDNMSIICFAQTCRAMKEISQEMLDNRGIVYPIWSKKCKTDGGYTWQTDKYVQTLTASGSQIKEWEWRDVPCMGNHLKECTFFNRPGLMSVNYPVIDCPNNCGIRLPTCNVEDHLVVCMNRMQLCVNQVNGCPFTLDRTSMGAHLEVCPASATICKHSWSSSLLYCDQLQLDETDTKDAKPKRIKKELKARIEGLESLLATKVSSASANDEKLVREQSSQGSGGDVKRDPACEKDLRRDQVCWHYKNIHNERKEDSSHSPGKGSLSRYGNPLFQYNLNKPKYGVLTSTDELKPIICNNNSSTSGILLLGHDLLSYLLLSFLDNASIICLAQTCFAMKEISIAVLHYRGIVHPAWNKKINDDGECTWQTENYIRTFTRSDGLEQ